MRRPFPLFLVLACGDSGAPPLDPTDATTTTADTSTSTSTSGPPLDTSSSGTESGSTSSSTGSSGTGFVVPVCGDEVVEGDEECDDGNDDDDDGCDSLCNLSGVVEWTVTWDDGLDEVAHAIAVAPANWIAVAGGAPGQEGNVAVRRYAADGTFLDMFVPETVSSNVSGIAIGDDNAIYLAGWTGDTGWTVRYDAAGVEQWRYARAGTSAEARAVAVFEDQVVVAGVEDDTEMRRAWVSWLDASDGAEVRDRTYLGSQDTYATGVAVSSAGVVAAGSETDPVAPTGWIRAYAPDGTEQWTEIASGRGSLIPTSVRAVALTDDGTLFATGRSDAGEGPIFWTAAYDAKGARLWTRTFAGDGSPNDGARAIALTPELDVIIAGSLGVVGQADDAFVRRYAGDGQLELWTSRYNDPRANLTDAARSVAVASDGAIYVAGETQIIGQSGDWWIRKYAP